MSVFVQELAEKGFVAEDLDAIVHNAADDMAANANNHGMEEQVEFLKIVAGWSEELILSELKERK